MEIKYFLLDSPGPSAGVAGTIEQERVQEQSKARFQRLDASPTLSTVDKLMKLLTSEQYEANEKLSLSYLCVSSQHVQAFELELQRTLKRLKNEDGHDCYSLLKEIDINKDSKNIEFPALTFSKLEVVRLRRFAKHDQRLQFQIIHGSIEGFKKWRPSQNAIVVLNGSVDKTSAEFVSEEVVMNLIRTWESCGSFNGPNTDSRGRFHSKHGSFELTSNKKSKILEPTFETKLNQMGCSKGNQYEPSEQSSDQDRLKPSKLFGKYLLPTDKGNFCNSDKNTWRPKSKGIQPRDENSSTGIKKTEQSDYSLEHGRQSSIASKKASLIDWLNSQKKMKPIFQLAHQESDSKANNTRDFPQKDSNTMEMKNRIKAQKTEIFELKRRLQIREELCKEYFEKIVLLEKELSKDTAKSAQQTPEKAEKIDCKATHITEEDKPTVILQIPEEPKFSESKKSLKSKSTCTEQIGLTRDNPFFIAKRYENKALSRISILDTSTTVAHRRHPSLLLQGSFSKNNGAKIENSKLELEYLRYKLSGESEGRKRGNKSMYVLKE